MLNSIELNESAAIVKKWREAGWITLKPSTLPTRKATAGDQFYKKKWYEARRDKFRAMGLNSKGQKPRVTKYQDHPELAKLRHNPKLYHKAYNRLDRGRSITDLVARA